MQRIRISQLSTTTIAVVGAGAIGGVMAAALGDCGHDVRLCVRTPFERLRRISGDEATDYDFPIHTSADGLGPVDWVFLCTKAYQNEAARPWLDRLVDANTRVAVMQNGVDHVERVRHLMQPAAVVPGIILLPAEATEPGVIRQGRPGVVRVPDDESGRAFGDLFDGHPLVSVEPSADFVSEIWKKLIVNAVSGAICTLTLTPIREITHPAVAGLSRALMEEIAAVGRAEGADIPAEFIEQCMQPREGALGAHWTSIAVDWREGRPMEWEARNAVVGRIGARHRIQTPLNDACAALLALADDKGGRTS